MLPVGPLMIEHRLIEKMIKLADEKLKGMVNGNMPDVHFIEIFIDFVKTYADRCHHGKEEDILFRDLSKRKLSEEHERIMKELIEEHKYGRIKTMRIVELKDKYASKEQSAVKETIEIMKELVLFYPKHIEKEDKHFFIPCMGYFNKSEQDNMLNEEWEFDRKLIHEKYTQIVDAISKTKD